MYPSMTVLLQSVMLHIVGFISKDESVGSIEKISQHTFSYKAYHTGDMGKKG